MDWKEVLKTNLGSDRKAADRLHTTWRKEAPKEARAVSKASIATKIGELRRGQTAWWKKRERLVQLFAGLLDVAVEDLLDEPRPVKGRIGFPEFPTLPPLQPSEEPCCFWREGWLLDVALAGVLGVVREPPVHRWVIAPPGWGKSLVVRYLRERYAGAVVAASTRTLEEGVGFGHVVQPLVIELEEADAATDAAALHKLRARASATIVLAPFGLPGAAAPGAPPWECVTVQSPFGLRERLVAWVEERLSAAPRDTRLARDEVLAWLEERDPEGVLFSSPGDVLALCADFDAHGADGSTLAERTHRWLGASAATAFGEDVPRTWAKRVAGRAYGALLVNHLFDRQRTFGPACGDCWARLAPADLGPPGRAAAVVVDYLREAGLLRGFDGGLVPFPSWVHRGLLEEALMKEFERLDPTGWGACAADPTRQPIVDDALDRLSGAAFAALVRTVARSKDVLTLARVGAVEATFAAAARRAVRGDLRLHDRDVIDLQELALRQVEQLVAPEDVRRFHRPFTRRDEVEWAASAWALSLRMPCPAGFDRQDLAWEIPGWAMALRLEDLPPHGYPLNGSAKTSPATPRMMAELALDLVDRITGTLELPALLPRVLVPAFVLSAPVRGWKLAPGHLSALTEGWCPRMLAERVMALPRERRTLVARLLWDLVTEKLALEGGPPVPLAARVRLLVVFHTDLAPCVLESLTEEDIVKAVREGGLHGRWTTNASYTETDPSCLDALPRRLRQRALRAWLDLPARGHKWFEARDLLELFDADDVDALLELVREADAGTAREFSSRVWALAPDRALEEAMAAIRADLPSAEGWFQHAPRAALPALAALVEGLGAPKPWVRSWARWHALDAGEAAEALFRLATGGRAS